MFIMSSVGSYDDTHEDDVWEPVFNIADLSDVSFVVLPHDHMKAQYHLEIEGLVNINSIVKADATEDLRFFLHEAQTTGNWLHHNALWTTMVRMRLTTHRWCIMVPSYSVGKALGAHNRGTMILNSISWRDNVLSKGRSPWVGSAALLLKLIESDMAKSFEIFDTNEALKGSLLFRAWKWIAPEWQHLRRTEPSYPEYDPTFSN